MAFPSTIATGLLKANNQASSTLVFNIDVSQTSIQVVDGSQFTNLPCAAVIDKEILKVTTVVGNVLTVVRAAEGSQAATHKAGSLVLCTPTASMFNELRTELLAIENALGVNLTNVSSTGLSNMTTVGAVPFTSASGVLNQAPSDFFWSAANKRLGVGTNTPVSQIDVVNATGTTSAGIHVGQNATGVGRYGIHVHQFANNPTTPSGGTGANTGFVLQNFSDAAPAMIVENTRSQAMLLLRNTESPTFSGAAKGAGAFLSFAGYGITSPTTVTSLGYLGSNLAFVSSDPALPFGFMNGLYVVGSSANGAIKGLANNIGLPGNSGTSEGLNALRVGSTSTVVSIDMGVASSPACAWIQARANTNYSINYVLALNPNGGNVAIGATTAATKLAVAGSVTITTGSLIQSTSSTPASSSAAGTTGQIEWDANYVYVCTATNTWKRAALATW